VTNQTNSQRWYVAVLVIASQIDRELAADRVVELQHRLIRATDDESAYARAVELGRGESHSYANAQRQTVAWEFIGLRDLCEIASSELRDGTELYGHIVRGEPASLVVAKERLSCFWSEANKNRTAADILGDEPAV
jgi:Domain of unknown function (DUF4288)